MTTNAERQRQHGSVPFRRNGASDSLRKNVASEDAVYPKITLRLMPLLSLWYLLAFLDRINVGYAPLRMKTDLGFSDAVDGVEAGIFFLSYPLFEVPSNLLLERIDARFSMLRIMFLWELTSGATMLVSTTTQFYVVRFLLGLFETRILPRHHPTILADSRSNVL